MNASDLREVFKVGEIIQSGGASNRKNASRLEIIALDDNAVRFQPIGAKSRFRVEYSYIDLLLANFAHIDPSSIQRTVNEIRLRNGLKFDSTTENYAYGLAKAVRRYRSEQHAAEEITYSVRGLPLNDVGFQASPKVRKAVEARGMALASEYFKQEGFQVEIKGKPYDLLCVRSDCTLMVEVKATQGRAEEIILTYNEVALSVSQSERMILAVVTQIAVDQDGSASGGQLRVIRPWLVRKELLKPIAYFYRLDEHC